MNESVLQHKDGRTVGLALVDAFRTAFHGPVIDRDDPGYATARRVWNAHIQKYPGLVARCADVADVVEAVRFAKSHDLLVAVRGGGHNIGGRGVCDGGLVIDLSLMRSVYVDPDARTVRVQGGALLSDVDRETHLHGLAVPLGVVSKTGVGGLTLGGGLGWLLRKHGLASDNLLACEVVTADGTILTASAESHPDLFWGLRGGGGNFGVVTSFLFRAHPVSTVLGGLIVYPREQARDVLLRYRDVMPGTPEDLAAATALMCLPDGTPIVGMLLCYCGDVTEGQAVIEPLCRVGTPLMDTIQPIPFPVMQKAIDDAFPDGAGAYWKSAFVDALSDDLLDMLIAHAARLPSVFSSIGIEQFDGAATRVDPAATAFAQRKPSFNVQLSAGWTDPADADNGIAWARSAAEALKPFSNGGYFLNYLGDEKPDAIAAAFGGNLPRLQALKARYDPDNFFSLNQNIQPRT